MPCVQYHLRHLQFASSSTTPFQLVHAWAAATPMQRSLAPWALVPKELPYEDWVQELVATWRKITDRFAAYLQDYEAKAADRRDSKHTWVAYRSGHIVMLERHPMAGDPSRILGERVEGPCRGGVRSPSTVWS